MDGSIHSMGLLNEEQDSLPSTLYIVGSTMYSFSFIKNVFKYQLKFLLIL